MKYLIFFGIFWLLAAIPAAFAQDEPEYYNADYLRYRDFVYKKHIHTPLSYREGWELSYPLIRLGSADRLVVRFDDLDPEYVRKDYYYTLIHCNENWQPSGLLFSEYAEGFEENPVNDHEFSFNTFCQYINYKITIPNEDVKPLISGNYLLLVYENTRENRVLTRRFSIYENRATIEATVKRNASALWSDKTHEIDFKVTTGNSVENPSQNISVVLMQNNRYDNAIFGLKPRYVSGNELSFDYDRENVFYAGNEYRHADLKSEDFVEEETDSIFYQKPYYHFQLRPDPVRHKKPYQTREDLNGKFLVKQERSSESHHEADYVWVHFALPYQHPLLEGNMYVFGALTGWKYDKTNMMTYNYERKRYELDLFLKQGYYNYEYAIVKDKTNFADNTHVEGSHFATENDYVIYVFYRAPQNRYTELIGIKIVNSINKN